MSSGNKTRLCLPRIGAPRTVTNNVEYIPLRPWTRALGASANVLASIFPLTLAHIK